MTSESDQAATPRQRWLGLLARASKDELDKAWEQLSASPEFVLLRPPETGLVMVRGRAGGTGRRFNLGEMTVTRASVRLADGTVGTGYIAGRDKSHTERVAVLDALLQSAREEGVLLRALDAIETRLNEARRTTAARAESTRVDFSTLAREAS